MSSTIAKNTCIADQVEFDLPDGLPIKNTFVHFEQGGTRSLRACQSDPADPVFLEASKLEHLNVRQGFVKSGVTELCLEPKVVVKPIGDLSNSELLFRQTLDCDMTDTTDDRSSLDLELDLEVLSIRTPELTPRHLDSPVDSLAASLMSTPTTLCSHSQVEQQMHTGPSVQIAPMSTLLTPINLSALTGPPSSATLPSCLSIAINITLRLAEKGKLGVYFGSSLGNDALVVHGILPGQAVHAWNRQCMFGNSDNQTRYVALGDVLMSVNGKTYWQDMLRECDEQLLLKMTFARMDPWASFGSY